MLVPAALVSIVTTPELVELTVAVAATTTVPVVVCELANIA